MLKYFNTIKLQYNYTDIMNYYSNNQSFIEWLDYMNTNVKKLNYHYEVYNTATIKIWFNEITEDYISFTVYYGALDRNYNKEYNNMKYEIENLIYNFDYITHSLNKDFKVIIYMLDESNFETWFKDGWEHLLLISSL